MYSQGSSLPDFVEVDGSEILGEMQSSGGGAMGRFKSDHM